MGKGHRHYPALFLIFHSLFTSSSLPDKKMGVQPQTIGVVFYIWIRDITVSHAMPVLEYYNSLQKAMHRFNNYNYNQHFVKSYNWKFTFILFAVCSPKNVSRYEPKSHFICLRWVSGFWNWFSFDNSVLLIVLSN